MSRDGTKQLGVRLTPDEHAKLCRLSGSKSLSQWIRETCLVAGDQPDEPDSDQAVQKENRRWGKRQKEEMVEALKPMNRTIQLGVRVTDEEYKELQRMAAGQQLAPWIRATCLSFEKQAEIIVDPKFTIAINRIGTNLNQIAHNVNSWKEKAGAVAVLKGVLRTQKELEELKNNIIEVSILWSSHTIEEARDQAMDQLNTSVEEISKTGNGEKEPEF